MKACVVVGDIIKSQKIENLPEVIDTLRQALEEINGEFETDLLGEFRIFGGDSFEGCLKTPARAYEVYRRVLLALRPERVRYVAGVGEVESLADGNVLEMTGPIFVRVTEFLEEASKPRRGSNVRFHILSDRPELDRQVNVLASLIDANRDSWNDTTYKVAERADEETSTVTKELAVSRQAVHQQLTKKHIREVLAGERLLQDLIEKYAF